MSSNLAWLYFFFFLENDCIYFTNQSVKTCLTLILLPVYMATPPLISFFHFPLTLCHFAFFGLFRFVLLRSSSYLSCFFCVSLFISWPFLFYPEYHHLLLLLFDFYQPLIDSIDWWCKVRIHLDFFLLSPCLVVLSCSQAVSSFLHLLLLLLWNECITILFWFFFFVLSLPQSTSFSSSFQPMFMIYILLFCIPPKKNTMYCNSSKWAESEN